MQQLPMMNYQQVINSKPLESKSQTICVSFYRRQLLEFCGTLSQKLTTASSCLWLLYWKGMKGSLTRVPVPHTENCPGDANTALLCRMSCIRIQGLINEWTTDALADTQTCKQALMEGWEAEQEIWKEKPEFLKTYIKSFANISFWHRNTAEV